MGCRCAFGFFCRLIVAVDLVGVVLDFSFGFVGIVLGLIVCGGFGGVWVTL